MKTFIYSRYFYAYVTFILLFTFAVLYFPKGSLELFLNQHNNPAADTFFKYITHLGDGTFFGILLFIVLFRNYYHAIILTASGLFQSIVVSIFKRWIFAGLPRPKNFFDDSISLHFVDGVSVHGHNTFPSGHTMSAFALFAFIAILLKAENKNWSVVLFIFACLVGLSRVYLLQHFFIDIYAGSIIGISSVIFGFWLSEKMFGGSKREQLMNGSLFKTIKSGHKSK